MMTSMFASVCALMYIRPSVSVLYLPFNTCWGFFVCYLVSEGVILDRVLGCQTDAAEQDEEEDEVGEDVVVDDLMAQNPESKKQSERNIFESLVTKITGNLK